MSQGNANPKLKPHSHKKGNAAPSLQPDSADNKCLICVGTCFVANRPPTTACAKIGSVGVTQAAIARHVRNWRCGIIAHMRSAVTSQPHCRKEKRSDHDNENPENLLTAMTGPRRKARDFQ
jgi:hypothetical protein